MKRLTSDDGSRKAAIYRFYIKEGTFGTLDKEESNKHFNKKQAECDIYNKLADLEDILDKYEIDDLKDLEDRLTKYKFLANHKMSCVDVDSYNLMLEDLEKYHSIEKELGVDFSLLDKICQKGVYCFKESIKNFKSKRYGEISHIPNSDIHIQLFGVYKEKRMGVSIMGYIESKNAYYTLPMKDYGKTWALTKEELE